MRRGRRRRGPLQVVRVVRTNGSNTRPTTGRQLAKKPNVEYVELIAKSWRWSLLVRVVSLVWLVQVTTRVRLPTRICTPVSTSTSTPTRRQIFLFRGFLFGQHSTRPGGRLGDSTRTRLRTEIENEKTTFCRARSRSGTTPQSRPKTKPTRRFARSTIKCRYATRMAGAYFSHRVLVVNRA